MVVDEAQATPQPITPQELAESYREVARAQKRAQEAMRDAAQAAARTRDMILQFCVEAGVSIKIEEAPNDN